MTYVEINKLIASFGLPYSYYEFPDNTEQAPPFICFFYEYDDIFADNSNYVGKVVLHIELYTDNKDLDKESFIEAGLKKAGFSFGKESAYINSERMWQTTYSMEVIIDG